MTDYRGLPAWEKAMGLAHAVCAAAEAAGLRGTESGRRLRKAVIAVPSLVAEAWTGHEESRGDPLSHAEERLAELQALLSEPGTALSEPDRRALLLELPSVRDELRALRTDARA